MSDNLSDNYNQPLNLNRYKKDINNMDQFDKIKFRLESQQKEFIYTPDARQFSFYQICQFSVNKRYKVRKIIYNESADMISHREKAMNKNILDKFLKKCAKFKYTVYPVYDLDVVGFPDANEILTAKSQILNNY